MPYFPASFVLIAALMLTACTKPWSSTHEYTCSDGYTFMITYSSTDNPGDIAILEDASGKTKLPRAPSTSGTRYSNGSTVFFITNDNAQIQQAGTNIHSDCIVD